MKPLLLMILLSSPLIIVCQSRLSMNDAQVCKLSMNDASLSYTEGINKYYAKGDDIPFTGILYANYPSGELLSEQSFMDGVGQGQWINYYKNGNYKEIGTYEQNKVTGPIKKYHENGTLSSKGTYKDWRIKIGKWTYYDAEGTFIKEVDYGKKGSIEEVQEYYDRGDISYSWYAKILTSNGFDLR